MPFKFSNATAAASSCRVCDLETRVKSNLEIVKTLETLGKLEIVETREFERYVWLPLLQRSGRRSRVRQSIL